ncbi:MAG: SPOR domain-containing protein [Nitrospira sp.]|nr:SPOR domain-containing protein [Candidatus Manganitrophaceae bacterium]HIL34066.1 SPOR domain-containing protein [Candidatus Manganitrophaceae bacterium]
MRELRILKETEENPKKKKKPPILLITFMGILVFLGLFFLFEENPTEDLNPASNLSNGENKGTKTFRSEFTPGKIRIDSGKEALAPSVDENKKPIGPIQKKELTFLKTLKEKKKENPPLKIKKEPQKDQKITTKKKSPRKTKKVMATTLPPRKSVPGQFAVQVASFSKKNRAEVLAEELREKGYKTYVVSQEIPQKGRWYRVRIGHYADRSEAVRLSNRIKRSEKLDAFVTSDHR